MSAYGYEIVQTLIVDIEPDEHVKRAMNEINAGELNNFLTKKKYICFLIYFIYSLTGRVGDMLHRYFESELFSN